MSVHHGPDDPNPGRTDTGSRRCARRPRDTGRLPDASACRSDRLSIQDHEPALAGPRTRRPRPGCRDARWLAGVDRMGSTSWIASPPARDTLRPFAPDEPADEDEGRRIGHASEPFTHYAHSR